MSATITCAACGMQYDGTGMQAGVQFQCTQCHKMVVVGGQGKAPARPGRPGPGKPMGRAAGPRGAGARGAGGPAPYGANQQQQEPGFAANAPKKGMSGPVVVGIVGGVALIAMIGLAIGLTGKKTGEAEQAKADEAKKFQEDKAAAAKKAAETNKESADRLATITAGTNQGAKIASAMAAKDMAGLGAMFDWNLLQEDFNSQLQKKEKKAPLNTDGTPKLNKDGTPVKSDYEKFMNHPLYCEGEWTKMPDGRPTGSFVGNAVRSSESIRVEVMAYIEATYGGVGANVDLEAMDQQKTPPDARFSMNLSGKVYMGRVCMIKSEASKGKFLSFYVGGLQGDTNVKIMRFEDGSALENLKQIHAKYQPKTERGSGEFENPDRVRDPNNPDSEGPEKPAETIAEAKKTGEQCPQSLQNIFRDISSGKEITPAQVRVCQDQARPAKERKAFIGACVDALMDLVAKSSRLEAQNLSRSLFAIYGAIVGYDEKEVTYTAQTFDQANDFPLRAWYAVYTKYKG